MAIDDDIAALDAHLGTSGATTTTQAAPQTQTTTVVDPVDQHIKDLDSHLGTTPVAATTTTKKEEPAKELSWWDRPGKFANQVPMVDEYGHVIPGSEGTMSAMTPRQMAELAVLGASFPLSAGAGAIGAALTVPKVIQAGNVLYKMKQASTGAKLAANAIQAGTDAGLGAASAAVDGGTPTDVGAAALLGPAARYATASGIPNLVSYVANNPKAQAVIGALSTLGGGVAGAVGGFGHGLGGLVDSLLTSGGALGGGWLGHQVTPLLHAIGPVTTPIGNALYRVAQTAAPVVPYGVGQGTSALQLPPPM